MGWKRWARLVERQNRFYMRDRYLFFGSALLGALLVWYYVSSRVLNWIPEMNPGSLFPYRNVRVILILEAFFFGLESEKKYYLVRTRIQDPLYENEYVQSHLNAMYFLRMHAFDFGAVHRRLVLRRLPEIGIYAATAALLAYLNPEELFISNVIGYAALSFLAIMAGSEAWFRAQMYLLNQRSFVSVVEEPKSRIGDTISFILEGIIWCCFFTLVGSLFSNLLGAHLNVLNVFSKTAKQRQGVALGWLIAAFIIHTQAHIKGRKQLRRLYLLVGAILIADMMFYLPI